METQNEKAPVEQVSPWRKKAQMAEYYQCDIKTITNWMRGRILPFVKIGRWVRFDIHECDRAMEKYKRKSRLLDPAMNQGHLVILPANDNTSLSTVPARLPSVQNGNRAAG